jgi:hypothetical protein
MGGVRNFRRRAGGCLLFVFLTLALLIFSLEIAGRGDFGDSVNLFVLRAHTRIVGWDPDHRNKPGERRDINEDGIRTFKTPADISDESFNVIFLGDSFVFGAMLRPNQTMPSQLEALMREHLGREVNVLNFGWLSSSPRLSYRLLAEVGHEYRPDLVVLGLDMTDFRDDLVYRNILEKRRIFKLRSFVPASIVGLEMLFDAHRFFAPVKETLYGFPTDRFFATNQPLRDSRPHFDAVLESLARIHRYSVEKLGAPFALFLFPRNFQYSESESPANWERDQYQTLGPYVLEPFRFFDEIARDLPYPHFSLLADFRDTDVHPHCFRDDPHWNERGAGIAARAVFRDLEEGGLLPEPSPPPSDA